MRNFTLGVDFWCSEKLAENIDFSKLLSRDVIPLLKDDGHKIDVEMSEDCDVAKVLQVD